MLFFPGHFRVMLLELNGDQISALVNTLTSWGLNVATLLHYSCLGTTSMLMVFYVFMSFLS